VRVYSISILFEGIVIVIYICIVCLRNRINLILLMVHYFIEFRIRC